ncbi:MAG: hypothetical protein ASARMPRED_003616 [Alectoria sarmentosa]|nr:MAG: hypothetical protein ASARMPRED_003616 [Alectoria sarmentosa]
MPFSNLPCDERLTGNWLEDNWLGRSKRQFLKLSKLALKCAPVNNAFYLARVKPENLYHMTYGSNSELHNTLHSIYVEHGAFDLHVRGCDEDGKYHLKCSEPGRKRGTAKTVVCVSLAKVEKSKTAGVETESSQSMVDGGMQDWEEAASDKEVEDEWVKDRRSGMQKSYRANWLIDVQKKGNGGFKAEPAATSLSVDMVVESKVGFEPDVAVRNAYRTS